MRIMDIKVSVCSGDNLLYSERYSSVDDPPRLDLEKWVCLVSEDRGG